jgi:hypothetical protein
LRTRVGGTKADFEKTVVTAVLLAFQPVARREKFTPGGC